MRRGHSWARLVATIAIILLASLLPLVVRAQDVAVRDLVLRDDAPPVRLVGYGLVVGLPGTGDHGTGYRGGQGQTVQSVANLLRRFDVEVPAEMLRTRNVAAVLVTAEVSPYLRGGGRFDVQVSSMGDARSLRGGVLWTTPLVAEPGGPSLASAQGQLLLGADGRRALAAAEASARIPGGGILEAELPRPTTALASRLLLREPDVATAARIAAAVNTALGEGTARVEDPGAVTLALRDTAAGSAAALEKIGALRVPLTRAARIVLDARTGAIVAGGDIPVGAAVVSSGGITIAVDADTTAAAGTVRLTPGTRVAQIVAALQSVRASAADVAAALDALRQAGALAAEVVVQ